MPSLRHSSIPAVLLLACAAAFSQTANTGTVVGTVSDSSGAVVPAAQLTLVNVDTNETRRTQANQAGQYTFPSLPPGRYRATVTVEGFATAAAEFVVAVGRSVLGDFQLEISGAAATIEVRAGAQTELQTVDAAVGNQVSATEITRLPTVQRNALELVNMGAATIPATGTSGQYYGRGGGVAGVRGDQNTVTVDGVDTTERYTSAARGVSSLDLPVDAIEEFRSTTANPNALTGSSSSGGNFAFATRRGSNALHGAAYWYNQNNVYNANTWTNNRLGTRRPKLSDNRAGARAGGPIVKNRTFLFGFYEARRLPQSSSVVRTLPTDTLKQGILRFRDAAGNVISYDLKTSRQCGPAGADACDPRGLGISPLVKNYFDSLYPGGNDPSVGDGLNTIGYRYPADTSSTNDTAVGRLDHNFTDNWRFAGSFIYQRQRIKDTSQLELDKNITGGTGYRNLSGSPRDPRNVSATLTGQITPHLLNELRGGWNRQDFATTASLARVQMAEAGVPIDLASTTLDDPGDPNSDRARPGYIRQRYWSVADNLSWIRGSHIIQGGFFSERRNFYNARPDRLPLTTVPVAQVTTGSFVTLPATTRPRTCATGQANCLRSSDVNAWNALYGAVLGIWDNTQVLTIRDSQGKPTGESFAANNAFSWHNEIRVMDTWRATRSLTLTLGVNLTLETPWADERSREYFIADAATGSLLNPKELIRQKAAAAESGKVVNPTLEYLPRTQANQAMYSSIVKPAPRVSAAWNPSFKDGLLGRLFGDRKTVLRGGYSLVYDRILSDVLVTSQISSNEILNSSSTILAPNCAAAGSPGPGCAAGVPFRIGVDGRPFAPQPTPTVAVPYVPAARSATRTYGVTSARMIDPNFQPGRVHSATFTVQRDLLKNIVFETGWIGRYGRSLPASFNLNAVPIRLRDMSGKSNQTFAEAFDAVATQLRTGTAAARVTPQPWFENVFGAGQTAAIAAAASSPFITGNLSTLFLNTIDPKLIALGLPTVLNQQFDRLSTVTSGSWSNYNALFVSLAKRMSRGLQLDANWTWAHGLDTASNAIDSNAGAWNNPYSPEFDYSNSLGDLRHVFKLYGVYEFPAMKKSRLLGGWHAAFIAIARTGFPISVTQGGNIFGSPAIFGSTNESVPGIRSLDAGGGLHRGVAGSGGVGTNGNPATGGTGQNLFADPAAVFNSLRPFLLSQDGRSSRGAIRGMGFWNLDLSIGKATTVTERLRAVFSADFFNIFNHPSFSDPSLSLNTPASFGVVTAQLNGNAARGDFAGPRRIQFGLRLEF